MLGFNLGDEFGLEKLELFRVFILEGKIWFKGRKRKSSYRRDIEVYYIIVLIK
jgi:hypothetical protein